MDNSADKTVLYCMIHDMDCVVKAISKINEDYFFDYQSREMFKQILACYTENNKIDLPILYSWTRKNRSIEIITSEFIYEIAEFGAKFEINNFDAYLNQVIKAYKSHQLRILLEKKHKDIVTDENFIDSEISDLIDSLNQLNEKCSLQTVTAAKIDELKDRIIENVKSGKSNHSFGYTKIDGYCKPEVGGLVFIGGRPGTGKTTFAMNSILKNSEKLRCAYISYEMPDNEVLERFCQINGKHNKRFFNMTEQEISKQIDDFERLNIDIYDMHGKTELPIREILENNDYDKVVIDHVHEITSSRKFDNERLKYNYIATFIDLARKATKTTTFALLQINREVDNVRPLLRHLKETSCFEEKAQVVCFLYERPDLVNEDKRISSIEMIFAKNRFGDKTNKDDIIFEFNKSTMNFYQKA